MSILLAQAEAAPAQGNGQGGSPMGLLFPMLAIGLLMWVMLIRPQRRERATREAMISALKKNDRVVTASGIYGVVINVRPEADEVTVRVDDTSNTRLRMTMSSILRVLGDEPSSDKPTS
jgi:preprotein translocase subunit YajC